MLKINDFIRHSRFGICKCTDVTGDGYYILKPVYKDKSLEITLPISNADDKLHQVISYDEAVSLVKTLPNIEPIWIDDFRKRKLLFENIMVAGTYGEKCSILKTIYDIKHNLMGKPVKLTNTDILITNRIENFVFEELATCLDIPLSSVNTFIEDVISGKKQNVYK